MPPSAPNSMPCGGSWRRWFEQPTKERIDLCAELNELRARYEAIQGQDALQWKWMYDSACGRLQRAESALRDIERLLLDNKPGLAIGRVIRFYEYDAARVGGGEDGNAR